MFTLSLRPEVQGPKIIGQMYDVLGTSVVLEQKLQHKPVRFLTADQFYKGINTMSGRWYVHEAIRSLTTGNIVDIYYIKANNSK